MKVKYFLWLFLSFIIGASHNVYADSFGETCSLLPTDVSMDNRYLEQDTAYGFIKENIDIRTHTSSGCGQYKGNFEFCVRNQKDVSDKICTLHTIRKNETKKLGALMPDMDIAGIKSIRNIAITLREFDQDACLVMQTTRGEMPLLCRSKIKDYAAALIDTLKEEIKKSGADGSNCYVGTSKGQYSFSFSGITMYCLRQSLESMFYPEIEFVYPTVERNDFNSLKMFGEFQLVMKSTVQILLVLYVMFYGVEIALNQRAAESTQIMKFLLKMMLVYYFAVGFTKDHSGITEIILPLLVTLMSKFSQFVFFAAGSVVSNADAGLCHFDISKYEKGYEFFAMWDLLDCRIAHYWGIALSSGSAIAGGIGTMTFIPALALVCGLLLVGQWVAFMALLFYFLSSLSYLTYFTSVFAVAMIGLYSFAYLGPIFIPMVLFKRTEQYFDSWWRMMVSFAIQPMVIGGVIALCFTICDSAIYKNCEFTRVEEGGKVHFELKVPSSNANDCLDSLGYIMYELQHSSSWKDKTLLFFKISTIKFGGNVSTLIGVAVYLFIFSAIMKSADSFASALSSGISYSGVTISPSVTSSVARKAHQAYSFAKAASSAMRASQGDVGAAKEAVSDTKAAADSMKDSGGNKEQG